MNDRPLDKTQQSYISGENEALVSIIQSAKRGLARFWELEPTTTRDSKGKQVVTGARRMDREFYKSAFEQGFLKYHARSIDEIQWMREKGMLLSPNPKVSQPERIGGGVNDAIALNDSIIRNFNAWWKFCDKNHRRARTATVLVFGDHHNFSSASKAMRECGMNTHRTSINGLCQLGLELYAQQVKKILASGDSTGYDSGR